MRSLTVALVLAAAVVSVCPAYAQDGDDVAAGTTATRYLIERSVPGPLRATTLISTEGSSSEPASPRSLAIAEKLSLPHTKTRDRRVCDAPTGIKCYLNLGDAPLVTIHAITSNGKNAKVYASLTTTTLRPASEMYPNPRHVTHSQTYELTLAREGNAWIVKDMRSTSVD